MAGEDLLEDGGDSATGGKAGKAHKPLSKGQKIGVGIGLVTILLIIWQVHKQSAANAASSSTSTPIDPTTGYPTGSAQDQAALQQMQSSSSGSGSGSYGGGSGWGGGSSTPATDPVPADLTSFFGSLPSTNPLSPNYVAPSTTTSSSVTPSITVNVPPPAVVTQPASTVAATGGASTTNDTTPTAGTLASLVASLDPGHTTTTVAGKTYYGIGNQSALSAIDTAAKKQNIGVATTNAKALGLPGGKSTATYIG